jgi:hypothetical protein
MAGIWFDRMPPELQAYWEAYALRKAILRRLDELDVHNAVHRVNASEAPIEARDKVYGHRQRLMDMMGSRAREKGVQSLYEELTPSMREELEQIHKIEIEAGAVPPPPSLPEETNPIPPNKEPNPIAPEQTLEVRTETPPPVLSPEAPAGPKPAPSKPRKRRGQNRVAAAHNAVRAIGAAWEKRILDHLADQQAFATPDKAGEWRLETVLPKRIAGLELHPEGPNKSIRTLSLEMAAAYLKRLRDKERKRRGETKVRKKA